MKQLTNLPLFSLLSRSGRNENYQEELKNAYEELIDETLDLHQIANDAQSILRKLAFARIELITLQTS